MQIGGIVLCGGKSSRMGRPKLLLPFGEELMLQRVVRILGEVVTPIVVVAAPQQELPPLPSAVRIARDEQEHLGPLAGLGVGLAALAGEVEAAFAVSCDLPLLKPAFIRAVIDALGEHDLSVPEDETYYHPLAAVYRTRLAPVIEKLVLGGGRRPAFLIESANSRIVNVEDLRRVDPQLDSLRNLNTPEDYAAALQSAGLPVQT